MSTQQTLNGEAGTLRCKIQNHDRPHANFQKEGHPNFIYIGREFRKFGYDFDRSIFHNPYPEPEYGREQCLELFRSYFHDRLEQQPSFREAVENLRGKTLGCWCGGERNGEPCHGEIILESLTSSTD
jgi:hypothetical protein